MTEAAAAVLNATQGLTQVNSLATSTALTVWAATASFVVLIGLMFFFVFFARYVGRGPFVALLLSLYAGYSVYIVFPYSQFLPTAPALTAVISHTGLYLGLVFIFYIILRRIAASDFLYIGLFGLLILSFLAAAFLIALAYHAFAVTDVYVFNNAISVLFAPDQYFFWWFISPAIGLFFFAR